jgi:hypothetical protein
MLHRSLRFRSPLLALLLLAACVAAPAAALSRPAASPEEAPDASLRARVVEALPGCGCEPDADLLAQRDRIAAAQDVARARELALEDALRARRALGAARRVLPFSRDLATAHERLAHYERDVAAADDVASVALHFEDLVQIASADEVIGVDGDYDGGDRSYGGGLGCVFSRGELIAIVIGFVLGILPGIILLVVLC